MRPSNGVPSATDRGASPARTIETGDGLLWLAAHPLPPSHAIVTSLPDASELPRLSFDAWRAWFVEAARRVAAAVADDAVAVFFQTDVRREGRWVDKAHLVTLGAEGAGSRCLFHKVVCRAPAGTAVRGRPGYAHLLAFSRALEVPAADASPDVLPALGLMTWPKAMGVAACEAAVDFLLRATACRTVVDPFCGLGTVLAVANERGLDAVGVELSARRAEAARALRLPPKARRP